MRRYPLYIFDLDGTLYRGAQALPGASETLTELRRSGSAIRFLTNNSSQTPEAQATKLNGMGIEAAPEEVLTSAMGAAHYLSYHGLLSAFVVGEPGLVDVLAARGIDAVASVAPPPNPPPQFSAIEAGDCLERDATGKPRRGAFDAVVVGICRTFTYDLLNQAMQHILGGARFVATNTDSSYPMENGLVPGAGSIVAAVRTCTGVEPVVIGKPETMLIEMILKETGLDAKDTLVVGDRYETDIVSGRDAGCDTLLVLTGVTTEAPAGGASAKSLMELLG